MCTVFDSISSDIDEFLSIHRSANAIIFGNFIPHYKNWLIYSGGSDQPGEFCYNFFLSQWKDAPWEDILTLGASGTASAFCEWVQAGIDIYISQKNIRSSLIHLHGLHV